MTFERMCFSLFPFQYVCCMYLKNITFKFLEIEPSDVMSSVDRIEPEDSLLAG